MLKALVFAFGVLSSPLAFALSEGTLATTFPQVAIPYFETAAAQTLRAKDGTLIRYRFYPAHGAPKGTIVLVNGQSEYMRKYAEMLYDMRDWGYDIFTYDHRGQGESSRLLADPIKGWVDHWEDYVDDMAQLMREKIIPASGGRKIFIVAHSLGGGIAAAYLIQNPGVVSAFVASSPMWQVLLPWDLSDEVTLGLLDSLIFIDQGEDYALTKGADDWETPFAKQTVTSSAARYGYAQKILHGDHALIISGETNRWVREAIRLTENVRSNSVKLEAPMLVFEAGADTLVVPAAEEEVVASARRGEIHKYVSARHEIFMETDSIRSDALARTKAFLDSQLESAAE